YTETDPVFSSSVAAGITGTDTTNWNNKLETEVDGSVTNEIQDLANVLAAGTDANSNNITNLADPVNDQDAVTKTYVDALIEKISELEILTTTFKDFDGNLYSAIKIGNQIWMAENLKTTHYANGDTIPDGSGEANISGQVDPEYWFAYNNDTNNVYTYGRLYTWYTVINSANICPDGWRVPSDADWTQLTDYLGGPSIAGGKLKETGTTHWNSPNTGAINETGFTALPDGYRYFNGAFNYIGTYGYWWASTELNASSAWNINMDYDNAGTKRSFNNKKFGLSVRCIMD
ncbi:MAG: fibrobacter succinogenes major paralogous domain-containing protein, partial [Candidatus Marinimicrobia bacterium]|nr:fibrobacter succinogenes major paralogous domain-containing protein [Candidatus Neomarinimicrobiota bacterium]